MTIPFLLYLSGPGHRPERRLREVPAGPVHAVRPKGGAAAAAGGHRRAHRRHQARHGRHRQHQQRAPERGGQEAEAVLNNNKRKVHRKYTIFFLSFSNGRDINITRMKSCSEVYILLLLFLLQALVVFDVSEKGFKTDVSDLKSNNKT